MNDESFLIYQLRPVTFVYNGDESETKQYGLIAEEVNEVFPGIVARNKDGEIETVVYHVLPVLLLNEVQKLRVSMEQENTVIKQQNAVIENVNNRLVALEQQN